MSQCIESNQRKVYQRNPERNHFSQTVELTVLLVSCLNTLISEDAEWFEELHFNQFPTDYWSLIVSWSNECWSYYLDKGRDYLLSCWGPSVERLCSVPVFSIVTYSVFRGEMGAAEDGDLSANQRPTWASINQSEASMVWAALGWRGSALLLWNR